MKSPSFQSTWNLKDPFVAHLVTSLLNSKLFLPPVLIEITKLNFLSQTKCFLSLSALKFHNGKDLHTAVDGNGLWRIMACWERDNKVFVAHCSVNKYLSLDASLRQQTAVINFLNSVQISVLWHLAMLESLMSLESPCHFHDWSFFTRLWPFYLVSFSDKGSVNILIWNKLYVQE